MLAFNKQYENGTNRYLLAFKIVFICAAYGGFMELLQNYIFINRSGNWYDFTANAIGAVIGVLAYPLIIKYLPINRWLKIK